MTVSVPRLAYLASALRLAPSPMASMAMTAATPKTIPRAVSADRILWARSPSQPMPRIVGMGTTGSVRSSIVAGGGARRTVEGLGGPHQVFQSLASEVRGVGGVEEENAVVGIEARGHDDGVGAAVPERHDSRLPVAALESEHLRGVLVAEYCVEGDGEGPVDAGNFQM